jgi:hypothetical protein
MGVELQWPMARPLRLRVVVPHFFREGASGGGYGSGRRGNRLARSMALARCLGGVLALNRAEQDWILNIAERQLERTPASNLPGLAGVEVELHLFVCGNHWLEEVVELFAGRLQLHQLELDDPMQLPLAAVRQLLDWPSAADLSLYLEDDLVINDPRYAEKLVWFCERTDHQVVLMPHRLEYAVAHAPQRLIVDGPIKARGAAQPVWASDEPVVARGRFWDGQEVEFVQSANPHSGSFCVSGQQLERLRAAPWPPPAFVGPLETAATGVVKASLPVVKPCWSGRHFLCVEHGNPSFLALFNKLPCREEVSL